MRKQLGRGSGRRQEAGAWALLWMLTATATATATWAQSPPSTPVEALPGARVAIVIDESGSLTDEAVTQERLAASSVAVVDPSADTQVAIIGFGSSNGANQSAAQTYCSLSPTRAPEDRTRLQACADRAHKRPPAEGNDTDFVAALQAGINEVKGGPEGTPRIVFLLTDGVLDVGNSPQFGPLPGAPRTAEATRQLAEQVLADAAREHVQIWPLGFGAANLDAMSAIAAGGFGVNPMCVTAGAPKASLASVQTVARLALDAFASARCGGTSHGGAEPRPGGTVEVHLSIPAIATDGSIVVSKPDPDILVTYLDPDGQPVPSDGTKDGSTFSASGAGRQVESLRITNPRPGTWTVRLTAPSGAVVGTADATAIFTGAVHASILVSPPTPAAGATVTAQVRVLTRRGAVLDAASLGGLRASLRLTGTGFEPVPVPLNDEGRAPDTKAGDGVFGATFRMPTEAKGAATLLGLVDASGLTSDARPYNFVVPLPGTPDVVAEIDLRPPKSIHPGDTLHASVSVSNPGPSAVDVRFSLEEMSDGVLITVDPVAASAAPGGSTRLPPIALTVGSGTSIGPLAFKFVAHVGDRVVGQIFVVSEVTRPPNFWDKYLVQVLTITATTVAAAIALILLLRRRRPPSIDNLYVKLIDDQGQLAGAPVRGKQKAAILRVGITGGEDGGLAHLVALDRVAANSVTLTWTRSAVLRYKSVAGNTVEVLPGVTVLVDGWRGWGLTAERTRGEPQRNGSAPVRLMANGSAPPDPPEPVRTDPLAVPIEEPQWTEHPPSSPLADVDPFDGVFG